MSLKQVLQPIFYQMGMDTAALPEQQSYRLGFDGAFTIELQAVPDNFLTITCALIMPENASSAQLWNLLQANLLDMHYPSIQTAASRESGEVILWTRERISHLNHKAVQALFERFVLQAEAINDWLLLQRSAVKRLQPASANSPGLTTR